MASSDWIAKILMEDERDGLSAKALDGHFVSVERETLDPTLIAVLSIPHVKHSDVAPLTGVHDELSFLVNIPSSGMWDGEAIETLAAHGAAFGGVGDLRRAITMKYPGDYVFKEYEYVERRLRQHRAVNGVSRIYDRVWRVHRKAGDTLSVAISDKYDLTADEVRTLYDRYGHFDVLFHTNNMGRIVAKAVDVGTELGIDLISSKDLFDRLGR